MTMPFEMTTRGASACEGNRPCGWPARSERKRERTQHRSIAANARTGAHGERLLLGHHRQIAHDEMILCPVAEHRAVAAVRDQLQRKHNTRNHARVNRSKAVAESKEMT